MKRYIIHPGTMQSKTDGDIHFISASQLMRLYNVSPNECIIMDRMRPETYIGLNLKEYVHLYPRYDGNYKNKE